jgi:hypothetical protein
VPSSAHCNALSEMTAILAESAGSMGGHEPCDTAPQRSRWWRQRVALDARVAALLGHMDFAWLGPWRYGSGT